MATAICGNLERGKKLFDLGIVLGHAGAAHRIAIHYIKIQIDARPEYYLYYRHGVAEHSHRLHNWQKVNVPN